MIRTMTLTALAMLISAAAPDALADQHKSNKKKMTEAQERSELQIEHKEAVKLREKDRESAAERAEEMREEAKDRAEKERERAEQEEGFGSDLDEGEQNAAERGSAKAQEMRARRDERKRIKEEYDATREKGRDDAEPDPEVDEDEERMAQKDKKPWWKFWGD